MQSKWLVCALLGTMAVAQANTGAPAQPGQQPPAVLPVAQPDVKPTDVVLTITGFCPKAAAPKTAAGAKAAAKPASAKAPTDCKTVVTRAEFEKLANALAPSLTPQFKHQLANILPRLMVLSAKAESEGLQNTPRYAETMKFARMQILTQSLQSKLQEDSTKVSDADIKAYYDAHPDAYQQYSIDRIFIPRTKQEAEEGEADADADKDAKLTEEQQKAKQADEVAKKKSDEDAMTKLAASLRDRAAAGEDFAKLQKEAYAAAGMKIENINVNIPKMRKTGLPQGHTGVFDLKPGEVSQVITDAGGHYIYRVNTKDQISLEAAKDEIHNTLQTQKLKESMDALNNSFKSELNDSYFGTASPGGPRGGMPPPHLPRPVNPPGSLQKPAPTPSGPGADPAAKPN
jgi:PPIC-type PPIASE domain